MSAAKRIMFGIKSPIVGLWLLLAMVLASIVPQAVFAYLVSGGPTSSPFGYVVSKTTDVNISLTSVGVYYDTNTAHTITINNAQLCDFGTSSGDTENMGDLATAAKGTAFNTFAVYKTDVNENISGVNLDVKTGTVLKRSVDPASDCVNDDLTLVINPNELVRSDKTGKYVAIVRAAVLAGAPSNNQNSFRITAPGGLVGVIGANNSVATTVRGSQAGYNYNPSGTFPRKNGGQDIYFGTPCDVPSPQTAYFHLYDVDNDDGTIQNGAIRAYVEDITNPASIVRVFASFRDGFNGTATPAVYTPVTGSSVYATMGFPAQPNHKYKLNLDNIDNFNTIQLTLPYDSIYADINCANVVPELDPKVTLTPSSGGGTVAVGETISGAFSVTETNRINDGVADYFRRLWVENGTDSAYGAGDVSIANACTASGANYTFAANTTTTANCSYTVTGGNEICGVYQLTGKNTANGPTSIVAPNPEVVCVPIAKSPKVQVSGGDVWVGGKLTSPCTVTPTTARLVGVDDSNGNSNASFGELATTALGGITEFGSRNLPFGNPSGLGKSLTFAYTPTAGNFMGAAPVHCLTDPYSYYAGSAVVQASGLLTGLGPLGPNAREIRRYPGSLSITGNVTYQDIPYAYGTMPQFVALIDGDLVIDRSVTQLDGLYVVKGKMWTCNTVSPATRVVRGGVCDSKLQINGAIYLGKTPALWRTEGAEGTGAAINDKSEVINLRPDLYFSECQRVCGQGIQTVTEQEAPVRF